MSRGNPVFAELGTTIFTVMSALAVEHGAINLGQGFPDEDGPLAYARGRVARIDRRAQSVSADEGTCRTAARHRDPCAALLRSDFDPETEVLVTSGATEALTASIMGLVGPGEEVVLIEPSYDSYRPFAMPSVRWFVP